MASLTPIWAAAILFLACTNGIAQADTDNGTTSETSGAVKQQRAVLVTGASSGIGRHTAEHLAANGFYVYAGARKEKDLQELTAIENIQGIRLDVTRPEEIAAAVETVTQAGRGLYGLINNAGVLVMGPLIEISEEDLSFQLDVNVLGPYRVTKAFAPLLIKSKGRILTTGSISGIVTWGLGGPYTMSKHAIEAYCDVLAAEMERFGVQVSLIDPGNYKSRIATSMQQRMSDHKYSANDSLYRQQMESLLGRPMDRSQYKEPDEVAAAFLHALTHEKPKRRYMVVPNQWEAEATIRAAITRVVQLNEDQTYSYDRDQLVELLDEALKNTGR